MDIPVFTPVALQRIHQNVPMFANLRVIVIISIPDIAVVMVGAAVDRSDTAQN
jgi:hypothetical protein